MGVYRLLWERDGLHWRPAEGRTAVNDGNGRTFNTTISASHQPDRIQIQTTGEILALNISTHTIVFDTYNREVNVVGIDNNLTSSHWAFGARAK